MAQYMLRGMLVKPLASPSIRYIIDPNILTSNRIENRKTQDGIELIITMNMDGGDYQFRFVFNEDIDGVYYQDDDGAYASDLINKTAPEEHNRDDWMWGGISSAWFSKNLKYFQVPDAEEMGLEPL